MRVQEQSRTAFSRGYYQDTDGIRDSLSGWDGVDNQIGAGSQPTMPVYLGCNFCGVCTEVLGESPREISTCLKSGYALIRQDC